MVGFGVEDEALRLERAGVDVLARGVVEDAIQVKARSVWAQLGIYDGEAARRAEEAAIPMLMNNCIMVTYNQLMR